METAVKTVHNFNAGPSVLPREVFQEASQAIIDFNNSGLSILEIGHRTKLFEPVLQEAVALIKDLMQLDADHEVLYLHGGASTQFFQVPMNLLHESGNAAYIDTGVFAAKALKEAKQFGKVSVVASSKNENYNHLPKTFDVPSDASYIHFTSNNTIEGTQWQDLSLFYNKGVPLVADMSSDILSRQLDFNRFDLIYAGAQKNIGAAGVNLVVVNKNALGKVSRPLPTMLDYREHIANGSMLNTPPVFAIYVCMLTLRWLKKNGGIAAAEKRSQEKAALVYHTIDSLPMIRGTVANKEDRSRMNATFVFNDMALEKEFLQVCKEENIIGIQGHRSVGGFRISLYNALELSSVQLLTDIMKDFARRKG